MRELTKKERFNDKVLSRFNLYNSIFSTLPYESIANTGVMLPLFEAICVKGYNNNKLAGYYFDQLVKLTGSVISSRPEISEAKKFLINNSSVTKKNV